MRLTNRRAPVGASYKKTSLVPFVSLMPGTIVVDRVEKQILEPSVLMVGRSEAPLAVVVAFDGDRETRLMDVVETV